MYPASIHFVRAAKMRSWIAGNPFVFTLDNENKKLSLPTSK